MLTFFFPALFFNWSKPPEPTTRPSIPDRHNASFPSRPPPSGDLNDPMVDVDYNSLCIHYLVMRNILVSPLWDPLFSNQDLFYQLSLWNQCKAAFHVGRMINVIMNGMIFHLRMEYQWISYEISSPCLNINVRIPFHKGISATLTTNLPLLPWTLQGNRPRRRSAGREMHRRGAARRVGMPKWKAWHRDKDDQRCWFVFQVFFVWEKKCHHERYESKHSVG